MTRSGGPPQRRCVACREPAAREDLVRLVLAPDGTLVVDYAAKLPGRGAWVHPAGPCVDRLASRPGMLRKPLGATPDSGELRSQLSRRVDRAVRDGLSMAAAAGALVGGRERLGQALANDEVVRVVLSCDAAPKTAELLRAAAREAVPFITVPVDTGELGAVVGKGPRAALGVRRSRAATYLVTQLDRMLALG